MSFRRLILLLIALFAALAGAALLLAQQPATSSPPPALVMAPADATITATPFQPLPPTPTYFPTNFPTPLASPTPALAVSAPLTGSTTLIGTVTPVSMTQGIAKSWNDYPGPSLWPDIDVPSPVGLLPQPEDQINILLLGSDQRPDAWGFRTDTILLATLNTRGGTVSLTSFPRDLYVYIPGWTVQRINTAFGYGDFDALALTFEYNFGVRPTHYVLVNFWSFKEVIDNLGGVDVNVAVAHTDHRDNYGDYTAPAGIVHMDGETALWYARSRYTTSDIDRGRRQQEVVVAIFQRLLSLDALNRAPELYDIYVQNVVTDLRLEDVVPLLPLAAQLNDSNRIHRYSIGYGQLTSWVNTQGAQVLLPIQEAVVAIMRQALNSDQ